MYEEMTEITLNCVIKDNPIEKQFQIKIDKKEWICELREVIKKNQSDTFMSGSLSIKLWQVDIDPDNKAVLEQVKNADSDSIVESVSEGTRIIDGFSKIENHFSNLDPNKIHLVVQGTYFTYFQDSNI